MEPVAGATNLNSVEPEPARARFFWFALVSILPVAMVWVSMQSLAAVTLRDDTYSHIPLIPVISFFLVYLDRQTIFARPSSGKTIGGLLLAAGAACFLWGKLASRAAAVNDVLAFEMLGVVLAWAAAFALFFGQTALRLARFQFLFLLFMVPIPQALLGRAVLFLQQGSANVSAVVFNLLGIPVFRQGLDFTLPGVTIRVAEECSGIRSTLALLMMALLAGHMFLRGFWKQCLLCLLVFPVAIFKNGLRIVTLTTLAVYVNPEFLHGHLHKYGGLFFFVVGLLPLFLLLVYFRKLERKN